MKTASHSGSSLSLEFFWETTKAALKGFKEDRAASMGAALAYYTAFSIAPLLIVVVAVAGLVFGRDAAQAALIGQLADLLGTGAADAIADMLMRASDLGTGIMGITVGLGTLILAATTAFVELQDDLDRIWKAEPRVGNGLLNLIKSRLLSFAMVLFIGFLLTVSLALSAGISAVGDYLFGEWAAALLQVLNFVISFAVITVLFAMIYKILPNVNIVWSEVWIGAAVTSLLFSIGKLLIGLYVGRSSVASSFGAAGPFVVMLIWIYYSTQVFLLGAEFAAKFADRHRAAGEPGDIRTPQGKQRAPEPETATPAVAAYAGSRSAQAFLERRRAHATGDISPARRSAAYRHRWAR